MPPLTSTQSCIITQSLCKTFIRKNTYSHLCSLQHASEESNKHTGGAMSDTHKKTSTTSKQLRPAAFYLNTFFSPSASNIIFSVFTESAWGTSAVGFECYDRFTGYVLVT